MSASFPFVPRHVASRNKKVPSHAQTVPNQTSDVKGKGKSKEQEQETEKQTSKPQYTDQDLVSLTLLAISNHALWADGDLRRKVEWATTAVGDTENAGFIPLSFILAHSPIFVAASDTQVTENTVAKALRTHASHLVDVRMVLAPPQWRTWDSGLPSSSSSGMYEIRMKYWARSKAESVGYTKEFWDEKTVYLENIPIHFRSIPGIYRFVESLLPPASPSTSSTASGSSFTENQTQPRPRIQTISFPSHHLDKNDASKPKKCKGFAFVTLSDLPDARTLTEAWPWERRQRSDLSTSNVAAVASSEDEAEAEANEDTSTKAEPEAHKFGFRALSKARWEALREEYEVWRKKILDSLLAESHAGTDHATSVEAIEENENVETNSGRKRKRQRDATRMASLNSTPASPNSVYPPSCLVYVKNVHPETNKTTLKTLFGQCFPDSGGKGGVDYVDFNKGMDTCYLRLSAPQHALQLIEYFRSKEVVQEGGLDSFGTPLSGALASAELKGKKSTNSHGDASKSKTTPKQIQASLVLGRPEEIYWEKVPIKVKAEAVRRAMELGS
ncbi:hypothetical protein VKT23_015829 [Stygiomarasmius scandens]|uniref:XRRM domain-containing protein n=1 Tax=Marasmiellus scandens TaxID=2682957 RepID=A0ABR1IZH3_9AGAR